MGETQIREVDLKEADQIPERDLNTKGVVVPARAGERKEDQDDEKVANSLRNRALFMTILPLVLLTLVISIVGANLFTVAFQRQIRRELKSTAEQLLILYEEKYPGEYAMWEQDNTYVFVKGENILSAHHDLLELYQMTTGYEISFFYKDLRVLTTLKSNEATIEGTGAHAKIVYDVQENQRDAFYTTISINDKLYYAYYKPIFEQDHETVFGMVGVARDAEDVKATVRALLVPILVVAVIALFVAVLISAIFSHDLITTLGRIERFLEKVAKGNLSAKMDEKVRKRKDELGKISREAVSMEESLQELIDKDVLTGLFNRRYGNLKLEKVWKKADNEGMEFAIGIADIDFFKKVNDTYGHECGDLILRTVADILKTKLPAGCTPVRWGGEEFLLIFENMGAEEAEEYLQHLIRVVEEKDTYYEDKLIKVTLTVGITEGDYKRSIDDVVSEADELLYQGKQGGRNRVVR